MIIVLVIKKFGTLTVIKWQLYLAAYISSQTSILQNSLQWEARFRSEPLQMKFDARCFTLSGLFFDNVRVFFSFFIFEISSALSGRLCGLSHATHWWRYVLITFTSFKHRALYWNCFYYYAQFYFRCLIQLPPALEKPKTTPNNLQNVLEIIGKREKGDVSRVTAHWLIFELASYGSGSLALLFTKVITWPRLCCDPITVVSTHDACVHHFSHHVPHATRQIATFCNMRRGLFNSFNNCPIEWPFPTFPASPALSSLIPAGGLKANCTSPRLPLFLTLSLSPTQQLQPLAGHQMLPEICQKPRFVCGIHSYFHCQDTLPDHFIL